MNPAPAVPAIVIRNLDVAHGHAGAGNAQQEAGPGSAAGAGTGIVGIGLGCGKSIDAAEGSIERSHVLQRTAQIHAELEAHGAFGLVNDVGDSVALFAVVHVGGTGAAEARRRAAAAAQRRAREQAVERRQTALRDARKPEQRIQVGSGLGIPLRIDGVAETCRGKVQAQFVDQSRTESVGIRQQRLRAPAIEGGIVSWADRSSLDLDDGRGREPAVEMVVVASGCGRCARCSASRSATAAAERRYWRSDRCCSGSTDRPGRYRAAS